jgi:mRNA interferase RelE/StbE
LASSKSAKYTLAFLPDALAEWRALDGSAKKQFEAQLRARLLQPHRPGSELRGPLRGYYKIKLRRAGYRLIYRVEDERVVVTVVAVGLRADDAVYVAAIRRLLETKP